MLPLDPSKTAFNWPNARACAEACARIYQGSAPAPGASDGASPSGISEHWIISGKTDAHALIQIRDDCILLIVRGSKDPEDYLQDAKFDKKRLCSGPVNPFGDTTWAEVHEGFLEDWESIEPDVLHTLQGFSPAKPIFLTGHSLGGGVITLGALELVRRKFPIAGSCTFGSPRVGNDIFKIIYDSTPLPTDWARTLGDITFRIVNENDIVPRVPPWWNDYRHVGQNIFLPCFGRDWILNPSKFSIGLSDALGLWGAFRNTHDVLITDHHIGAYQSRIQLL